MKILFAVVFAVCMTVSSSATGNVGVDWDAAKDKVENIAKNIFDGFESMRQVTTADDPELAVRFNDFITYTINVMNDRLSELQEYIMTQSSEEDHAESVMSEVYTDVTNCKTVFTSDYAYGSRENFSSDTISSVVDLFGRIMDNMQSEASELVNILRP